MPNGRRHLTRLRRFRSSGRRVALLAAAWLAVAQWSLLQAQSTPRFSRGPVTVRYSEGTVHGFLELRTEADSLIAHGDVLQVPGDSSLESRMVLRFADKSVFEETTEFSQHQSFRMLNYHLVQRGPAFGADLDATLSADGRFLVTSRSHKDGKDERFEGRIDDFPTDVANGLPVVLAKNLRLGDTAEVHLVAFTPKPRLIGLRIASTGRGTVRLGPHEEQTVRFVVSPQLGALTKFFAKLLGKLPPDSHIWVITEEVPAFIRFEGPMYSGPVWRLNLTTPTWVSPASTETH